MRNDLAYNRVPEIETLLFRHVTPKQPVLLTTP